MSVGAAAPPMRLGGKGGNAKGMAMKILAWVAFVFGGLAASPLLAATFVGGILDNILSIGPNWMPPLAAFLICVGIAIDLIADGIPNRLALYGAMLIASVARSVDGKLGDNIESAANQLRDTVTPGLEEWMGTGSIVAMALALAGAGWLISRRTMAAKSSGR